MRGPQTFKTSGGTLRAELLARGSLRDRQDPGDIPLKSNDHFFNGKILIIIMVNVCRGTASRSQRTWIWRHSAHVTMLHAQRSIAHLYGIPVRQG